jgi:mono/diheme cytochrome c family protein
MTASAFRRTSGQGLVPLKQSCPLCHGPGGQVLGTGSKISRPRSQLLPPDNAVEQERVMRAKRKDASYPALVEALAAP